jgi:hypothetical protein
MNRRIDAERILDAFLAPESDRLPDRVIDAALSDIARTPQRHALRVPWRFPNMPTYMKLAAAAALVIAVGGLALWQLAPGGPGATPGPSATQTTSTTVAPSPTSPPTARPEPTTYVPGALTQTFTSDVHGVSLRYPEGWAAKAATEPWTEGGPPLWSDPTGDRVHDDADLQDHLFLTIVSRPLDGASLDEWFTDFFADPSCTPRAGGSIDGADRVLRGDCVSDVALASSGGRGYVFELRASNDDAELRTLDTAALLDAILATVQLHPEDAVDE